MDNVTFLRNLAQQATAQGRPDGAAMLNAAAAEIELLRKLNQDLLSAYEQMRMQHEAMRATLERHIGEEEQPEPIQ